jgi:hypothetical protein
MKRLGQVLTVAVLIVLTYFALCHTIGMKQVEYRGATIKLRTCYLDYDSYKNDPNNLAAFERDRVRQLVTEAAVSPIFANETAMNTAVFDLKFPGYGFGPSTRTVQSDGTVLFLFAFEVPTARKDRYLVFEGRAGRYLLIDDFVADSGLDHVTLADRKLAYTDTLRGIARPLERPLRAELPR